MNNESINEIFLKLDEISSKKGIQLRYASKSFFVSLIRLYNDKGSFDSTKNMGYVQFPISYFCEQFRLSNHVVQDAISSLSACGLIYKIPHKKNFRKISTNSYESNKPNTIYMNLKLLEKRCNKNMDNNIFDTEEQVILNRIAIDESKDSVIEKIDLSINVCTDDEVVSLMSNLKYKILNYSNENWIELQLMLPFDTPGADSDTIE